jgi:Polyketide cyclase / dehydrase and lipid transport
VKIDAARRARLRDAATSLGSTASALGRRSRDHGGVPFDPARSRGPADPGFGRRLSIALERTVDAPMERVWTVLRDYVQARPRILTEDFSDYVIHEGGRGAGTVIGYGLPIGRRRASYALVVEEPTPGRQLRERDRSSALVTTWTLTPGGEGERTLIHLAVDLRDRDLNGRWARARARRALRRLYGRLLERLAEHLAGDGG